MNPFDEREVDEMIHRACIAAVAEGFPHLAVAEIIEPRHGVWDAMLARQIVFHLMVSQFGLPKRRIAKMQQRDRKFLDRALSTVDWRLEAPAFANHYRSIAARALTMADVLREAA